MKSPETAVVNGEAKLNPKPAAMHPGPHPIPSRPLPAKLLTPPAPPPPPHLDDYREIIGQPQVDALRFLARDLKGKTLKMVNSTDPLRLAEEIALLDILSGGRVYWGAGRGFDPKEFRTFGMTPDESYPRFRESVDIVMAAWRDRRVSYQGKYFSFENVEVLPKPLQQPHPPMWVAAFAPSAIEWAAQQGYSIMLDPHSPTSLIGEKMELWRKLMVQYGHRIEGRVLPTVRLVAIADTDAKAADIAREGSKFMLRTYVNPQGERGDSDTMANRYVDQMVIHGTAERVVEKIRRLHEEIGLDYMITAPLSHETFLAFTDRVLPQLATSEPAITPMLK